MAADRLPGRMRRVQRVIRSEVVKASRQPILLIHLVLVLAATAAWGPIQHSIAKGQEKKTRAAEEATHSFGEPDPVGGGEDEQGASDGRGANGFLVLAASSRAGATAAAVLLLLYAATLLAGESTAGTCRMILVRPVTRTDVILGKSALLLMIVTVFVLAIAATAFLAGLCIGDYGDYVDVRYGLVDYTAGDLSTVALASLGLLPLALLAVAAFGLLISSIFDSSATAVTAATVTGLGALVLGFMVSSDAAGWMFHTYVDRYLGISEAFSSGLTDHRFDLGLVMPGVIVPTVSAFVFLLAARIIFTRRDMYA